MIRRSLQGDIATCGEVEMRPEIFRRGRHLGKSPYVAQGHRITADRWAGPDALLRRIEWAAAVGERAAPSSRPLDLGAASLGESFSERTRSAVARAASAAQGLTLLLASPEFQRR